MEGLWLWLRAVVGRRYGSSASGGAADILIFPLRFDDFLVQPLFGQHELVFHHV